MFRTYGIVALALALPATAVAQSWSGLSGEAPGTTSILHTVDKSSFPSLALDAQGRPVAAWLETATGAPSKIMAMGWDSGTSTWKSFGSQNPLLTTGSVMWPSMDCRADGSPVVAYSAPNGTKTEVYVLYYDAPTASWKSYVDSAGMDSAAGGGISQTPTADSQFPVVRVNRATGFPAVVWFDGNTIRAKFWNGSDWIGRAGSDTPGGIGLLAGPSACPPSMELDSAGNPVVAYANTAGLTSTAQVYLLHLDSASGTWGGIAGSSTGLGISADDTRTTMFPSLRLDPSDRPSVAWQSYSISGDPVFGAGVGAGAVADAGGTGGGPQNIYFRCLVNGAWTELNGSATGTGVSRSTTDDCVYASVALLPGPVPMVFWQSGSEIQGRYYDASADDWLGLGGSEQTPGVSATTTASNMPRSAVAPDGSVYLCWEENFPGYKSDITLSRWINSAPVMSGVEQRAGGPAGATIPAGGVVVGSTSFSVTCNATDLEASPRILEVEARLVADAFTGAATHSSSASLAPTLSVTIDGQLGDQFKWRAWLREPGGKTSTIIDFGGNAPTLPDLTLRSNAAPAATTARIVTPAGWILPPGGEILAREAVRLEAPVDDPDSDAGIARFEVRRLDEAFTGTPTHSTALTPDGSVAMLELVFDREGPFRVRCSVADEYGAPSAWFSLGSNPDSEADIVVVAGGSNGTVPCFASSGGSASAAGVLLLLAGILGIRSPRRRGFQAPLLLAAALAWLPALPAFAGQVPTLDVIDYTPTTVTAQVTLGPTSTLKGMTLYFSLSPITNVTAAGVTNLGLRDSHGGPPPWTWMLPSGSLLQEDVEFYTRALVNWVEADGRTNSQLSAEDRCVPDFSAPDTTTTLAIVPGSESTHSLRATWQEPADPFGSNNILVRPVFETRLFHTPHGTPFDPLTSLYDSVPGVGISATGSFTIDFLNPDTTYDLVLQFLDEAGNMSAPSNLVTGTTLANIALAMPQPAPGGSDARSTCAGASGGSALGPWAAVLTILLLGTLRS